MGCDQYANHVRLTYSQMEQLWIQAGGPKSLAPLMAAIGMAESGGQAGVNNVCDNSGTQTSWGIWQISDGTHGWSYPGNPNDPLDNAKMAVEKYHSQGLGAWGTYTSGAFRQFLQGNVPPSTGNIPSGSGSAAGGVTLVSSTSPFPDSFQGVHSIVGDIGSLGSNLFGIGSKLVTSVPDALNAIAKAIGVIADVFTGLVWLMNPANDLRVISGLIGLIVLAVALYLVATA